MSLTKTIVVLGAQGQLGRRLVQVLSAVAQVHALGRAQLDLTDLAAVQRCLESLRPDVIVNAAAWTAVDAAQAQPESVALINTALPALLADMAVRQQAWLVHYSSDYVYSGQGQSPWREHDPAAPLSVYGRSKWAGDQAIAQSGAAHLVLRTSWVYDVHGHNFLRTMWALLQNRSTVQVVADQVGAPTPAWWLAQVTLQMLQQVWALPFAQALAQYSGLYHVVPAGQTSWYGFAGAIAQLARDQGVPLAVGATGLQPISSADYITAAPRPLNSRLCTQKWQHTFGIQPPHWACLLAALPTPTGSKDFDIK